MLSRSARLCEAIIRRSRRLKGGAHSCGRSYLARRLGCSNRTVSRYLRELRDAGRLEVTPPEKVRTSEGWRTVGTNTYRLPCPAHPAPHVQHQRTQKRLRRSRRGDTGVTPSPNGYRFGGPSAPPSPRVEARTLAAAAASTPRDQLAVLRQQIRPMRVAV